MALHPERFPKFKPAHYGPSGHGLCSPGISGQAPVRGDPMLFSSFLRHWRDNHR